jgi:DNA-binding NarL/FixJ family response regulator
MTATETTAAEDFQAQVEETRILYDELIELRTKIDANTQDRVTLRERYGRIILRLRELGQSNSQIGRQVGTSKAAIQQQVNRSTKGR